MMKDQIDNDLISIQQARTLSKKAKAAYEIYSTFPQDIVNRIVGSMATAGIEASQRLAKLAVEETGYGNVKDKIAKNLSGEGLISTAESRVAICVVNVDEELVIARDAYNLIKN